MNIRIGSLAALAAVALASTARAQVAQLAGRLDEPTRARVAAIADSARAAALPVEPLVNRALEGAAKGADGARILAAVRALAANLRAARAALGANATDAELVAGAAAIRAGAEPVFLARLRAEAPRQSLVEPLAVMADLVARGVPADTAAASVLALVKSGVREADLLAFRRSVESDIALGAPAGASAAARSGGVSVSVPTGSTGPAAPSTTPRKP